MLFLSGEKMKGTEFQKALEALGLTEYEAKAYVSLVEKGASNAGDLSEHTEIPHSKIYEVLMRLEKKKLVEVQKSRPLFFKAIRPSIAIQDMETELKGDLEQELLGKKRNLENKFNNRIREISKAQTVLEELDNFYEKKEEVEPSEEFVWTIRGKSNICNQAKEIILSAQSEVRLMVPSDDFSELESAIKTACSKGVKVQSVVHELTSSVQKFKDTTEVYYEKAPSPTNCGIILADDKKGMFISENRILGFKTASKSLLMVLAQFYEHEIEESAKVIGS
jgi:sugar-specific transcriptional regulator TrmB